MSLMLTLTIGQMVCWIDIVLRLLGRHDGAYGVWYASLPMHREFETLAMYRDSASCSLCRSIMSHGVQDAGSCRATFGAALTSHSSSPYLAGATALYCHLLRQYCANAVLCARGKFALLSYCRLQYTLVHSASTWTTATELLIFLTRSATPLPQPTISSLTTTPASKLHPHPPNDDRANRRASMVSSKLRKYTTSTLESRA